MICTGEVNQQVRAIAENIERHVKTETHDRLLHREGMDTLNWVILDYVNVVAHVFKPAFREFYRLENLWGDAELIHVEDKEARKPRPAKRTTAKTVSKESVSKPRTRKPNVKAPAARKPTVTKRTTTGRAKMKP